MHWQSRKVITEYNCSEWGDFSEAGSTIESLEAYLTYCFGRPTKIEKQASFEPREIDVYFDDYTNDRPPNRFEYRLVDTAPGVLKPNL